MLHRYTTPMVEGGNASVGEYRAEKMDIKKIGREKVRSLFISLFLKLDSLYKKRYKKPLWDNTSDISSGKVFTGSSRFLFDQNISDEEYVKYKQITGDIDIAVDRNKILKLHDLLNNYLGSQIVPNVEYVGDTKAMMVSQDGQINCIFRVSDGVNRVNVQVDFEGAKYDNGSPSDFAKFSHSSDLEDIKDGFKGVAHKFLLRALAKAVAPVKSFILLTPTSTFERPRISMSQTAFNPAFLSFSVAKGLRNKFVPVTNTQGKQLKLAGQLAYKEDKDTDPDKYITDLGMMFRMLFGKNPAKGDIEKFHSFRGCIDLINKYHKQDIKEKIISALVDGVMVQNLERGNMFGDMAIKLPILGALIYKFGSNRGVELAVKPLTKQKAEETLKTPPSQTKTNYALFKFDGKEHIVKFDKSIQNYLNNYYMNYEGERG